MAKNRKRRTAPPQRSFGVEPLLITPLTPFERRMRRLSAHIPPSFPPYAEILERQALKRFEIDEQFRKKCVETFRKARLWRHMRSMSGSGLLMANTLRQYFHEYSGRMMEHGWHSLPSSFNVHESFLRYEPSIMLFDLRPEREHLLAADDYFGWYAANDIPREPGLLMTAMEEGVVYEYTMAGDSEGSRLVNSDTTLVIGGVSLVRHQYELSCMLVAGEDPANPPDENIGPVTPLPGVKAKEQIAPNPAFEVKDRYLDQYPDFARVILLARFDLFAKKYSVRYVNVDCGNHYQVLTDDAEMVRMSLSPASFENWQNTAEEKLRRYDPLFSALASLIFLPVAFVAEQAHVSEIEFKAECFARQSDKQVKNAINELGAACCANSTVVHCLSRAAGSPLDANTKVNPPELEFEVGGYWKELLPGEIGRDKDGTAIVGRSWVARTESWSASKPQAFLLTRSASVATGPDPGIIYVMRSPAHDPDIFKIGLTRREPEKRSRELSSATGVALPFATLAHWEVGNCSAIEAEIHNRLAAYRINDRREFFRISLQVLVRVINSIVESSISVGST
jgi:T5orf172 domain